MPRPVACPAILAIGLSLIGVAPASAHHLMGGKLPSTFTEGLLSGLGHPVIGADHLAFLVAAGVIVGVYRLKLFLPALFVVGTALGVWVHVNGTGVPAAEIAVGISVLVAGALIARGRVLPTAGWAALFAIGGVFHGYAFGESIFGAEPSPLAAYLVGLSLIQGTLAIGISVSVRRLQSPASGLATRMLGAMIAGVGFAALMAQLVPGS